MLPVLARGALDAVIFDMDGVITDTAAVHFGAWKRLFDGYLRARVSRGDDDTFAPFTQDDYRRYVDGMPRYDGVRRFLTSRGIELPEGDTDDPADRETVRGLGNRKNGFFLATLKEDGVAPFRTSVDLLHDLRDAGFATAIISASRNAEAVLRAARVLELFDAKVDGTDQQALGFAGKPAPDVFLVAAERLGVPADRAAVVEDAIAGVQAGRDGGFALVVGVDRTGHPDDLRTGGADVVVSDLGELEVEA